MSRTAIVLKELAARGVLLESARGPVPNVAELVAGEPIKGSWWGHPAGPEIYDVLSELEDNADVARLRLLAGKITFAHRLIWPALVRLSGQYDPVQLATVKSEHTPTGAHRRVETPFVDWVPAEIATQGRRLTQERALAMIPACVRPVSPGSQ
jgi:hypothetical protein